MRLSVVQLVWALAGMALLLSGCGKSEITSYDVPKEELDELIASGRSPDGTAPQINWLKPESWEPLPLTAFRKGNFQYSPNNSDLSVDISVSSLPGEAGQLIQVANNWRAQLNLKPASRRELDSQLSNRQIGEFEMEILDIKTEASAEKNLRTIGAYFRNEDQSWQIKISGDAEVVEAQASQFYAFLRSLSFTKSKGVAIESGNLDTASNLKFEAPEGWTPLPNSPYRVANYSIKIEGHPVANFSISAFPGESGGIMANVNRWRRQVGLSEWTSRQIARKASRLSSGELEFLLFDLKPETESEKEVASDRILAAILNRNNTTWFFKMRGDPFLIETQRNRFKGLLNSVAFESESKG